MGDGGVLEVAEGGLAAAGEEFGDGAAGFGFDDIVCVEEAPAETRGEERADGGLAGTHEAGEDDAADGSGFRGGEHGLDFSIGKRALAQDHEDGAAGDEEAAGQGEGCEFFAEEEPGEEHDEGDGQLVERGDARSGAELEGAEVADP